MSVFKAKRVSGAELAQQLAPATAGMPAAVPTPLPSHAGPDIQSGTRVRPPKVVQINFKATEAFADLIAREAERAGSTRRFFANLMRKAGYDVPEGDVNPPDNRRRVGRRPSE